MDSKLSSQEKQQNIQPMHVQSSMVLNTILTSTGQPIVKNNTKLEYATYKTWSNPDMWKEDSG
jgi:hypothetical protein